MLDEDQGGVNARKEVATFVTFIIFACLANMFLGAYLGYLQWGPK